MAVFRYEGEGARGEGVDGYITAQDESQARARIQAMLGVAPAHVTPATADEQTAVPTRLLGAGDPPPPTPRPVTKGDVWKAYVARNFNVTFGAVFLVFPTGIMSAMLLSGGPVIAYVFAIPFAWIGGWILKKGLTEAQEDIWLAQHGATTTGAVTHVGPGNNSKNNQKSFLLSYEYQVRGATEIGSTETFNRRITRLNLGSNVWILFDPDRPDVSMLWPPIWRLDHLK